MDLSAWNNFFLIISYFHTIAAEMLFQETFEITYPCFMVIRLKYNVKSTSLILKSIFSKIW